jgi:HD-GYP domain-containing protein (c-di-GMP phosphodiesterase class II)
MLRLPIHEAKPGMVLALPVLHPQRGTMLLSEGFELQANVIRKLRELDVLDLWIEYPDTEQIKQFVSPAVLHQQSRVVELIAQTLDAAHRDAHAQVEFSSYKRTIQALIESLVTEPVAASYVVEMGGSSDNALRHAAEVCFLSVLLGLKLQGYIIQQRKRLRPKIARDVVSLAIGAMLHDVGMTALDESVRLRYEQARDEHDAEWRRHVTLGHKMLSGTIAPAAAGVLLHHHQHFDGSGFPAVRGRDGRMRGLAGEHIHVFARIVCVANHFDRLRRRSDGTLQPRINVLKQMLAGPLNRRFDPVIAAALPLVVPAYPPGSLVTLNNGERAVVAQWHAEAPCQPTVQVISESLLRIPRSASLPVRYDLRQRRDLRIVEHDGQRVEGHNFNLIDTASQEEKSAA